ncbi:MAG: 5-(carboxyamino)imidazole ribonucleotide synthase [bacterium]
MSEGRPSAARRLPVATVGIVGAGQLGLMLCDAARRLGVATCVLADRESDPAVSRADAAIIGDRFDATSLQRLADASDVITFEIEHAETAVLQRIADAGTPVRPSPRALETVRDKWVQRATLEQAGVPGPRSANGAGGNGAANGHEAHGAGDTSHPNGRPENRARGAGRTNGHPADFGYPFVQKLRRGGYDGRGVKVIRGEHEELLPGESMFEELVDISCEVAVLVGRTPSGVESVYPAVRMEFDPVENICTRCLLPAGLSAELEREARRVASSAVAALGIVGMCAVELFITHDRRVLVNELAPRPHNSGHLTIEASATSQFEQHLRAILDLPLGSVATIRPSVMVNLLGTGEPGPPMVEGLEHLLALPEAHLHLYDKQPSKPGRKMGHINLCSETLAQAQEHADIAERVVRIRGDGYHSD